MYFLAEGSETPCAFKMTNQYLGIVRSLTTNVSLPALIIETPSRSLPRRREEMRNTAGIQLR